jgi:hypothetical protein
VKRNLDVRDETIFRTIDLTKLCALGKDGEGSPKQGSAMHSENQSRVRALKGRRLTRS